MRSELKRPKFHFAINAVSGLLMLGLFSCEGQGTNDAASFPLIDSGVNVTETVTFETINSQILVPKCVRCHDGSEYADLTTESAVKAFIVSGRPDDSELYNRVLGRGVPRMPRREPLSASQIELIRRYIEGALGSIAHKPRTIQIAIQMVIGLLT